MVKRWLPAELFILCYSAADWFDMELFEAKNLKVSLYDKGTTIREIAAEKVKVQTDPEREVRN